MDDDQVTVQSRADRVTEIHAIALAEILTKSGEFDLWRYFEELNEYKRRPLTPKWREAYIMLGCIGQIRPAKVVGHLKRLRAKVSAEQFELFESRIRAFIAPMVLTNHGFREDNFANVDAAPIWSHVQELMTRLEGEGFDVFLNSGTLLGVTRDKGLITHDDDVDLAIMLKSSTQKKAAVEWKRLSKYLTDNGLCDPEKQRTPEIHKLTSVGSFSVDLFPAWIQDGKIFVYPHTFGDLDEEDVLPLQPCEVTGLKIPQQPEDMLVLNYGEAWRKPDPLFKFPWAGANEKFSEFLRVVQA